MQHLASQLLLGPAARSAVAVVDHLLAVQGQDPVGARLAIRSRSRGLTAADVDRALSHDRSLVVASVNRGTLHLIRSEDYGWLHALTALQHTSANARRLRQEGVTPPAAERGVRAIVKALQRDGPRTRDQLREAVAGADVPVARQALAHVLWLAALRGLIVRGPMVGREQAWVLTREWLGTPKALPPRDKGLADLARRYLVGHAPATDRDLSKWAGITLGDARRGLQSIAQHLSIEGDLASLKRGTRTPAGFGPPRLLGAFDPLLLGWASRTDVAGSHQGLITTNGLFRPFILIEGRAAGLWSYAAGRVETKPFASLTSSAEAALLREAGDVVRFLAPNPAPR